MNDNPPLSDELVSPLLHLLQVLRAAGGGDLEIHIILLAIAERALAHPEFRALGHAARSSAPDARPFPTKGVNVRSISESTGVPRETVRRKVVALKRDGWLAETPEGLSLTPQAYRGLDAAREALEQVAVKFHDVVAQRRAR